MPQILKHPPAPRIIQLRVDQPLPHADVIPNRPRKYRVPRHRKLRTTRRPHRDLVVVRLVEDRCICRQRTRPSRPRVEQRGRCIAHDARPGVAGDVGVGAAAVRAAGVPVAAEIDVAGAGDGVEAEELEGVDVGVEGRVGVPGGEEAGAVGVDEGDGGGEVWVVVDDVGEVGHGFFAFV